MRKNGSSSLHAMELRRIEPLLSLLFAAPEYPGLVRM